jgi:streptogramin lyase
MLRMSHPSHLPPLARVLATVLIAVSLATAAPTSADPGDVTAFATLADIDHPQGLALGPDGSLWFTNSGGTGRGHLGRLAPDGTVTTYRETSLLHPGEIVGGEDGNLWFSTFGSGATEALGRVDPADGSITLFTAGLGSRAEHLTPTPSGVWFTDQEGQLGLVAPDGTIARFPVVGTCCSPAGDLDVDPSGDLWYTLPARGLVVRATALGALTPFDVGGRPAGLTTGPDGNVWFTDDHAVGRLTPAGVVDRFAHDLVDGAEDLVVAGDGNLWFASTGSSRFGRITPTGTIRFFWHPSAASAEDLTVGSTGEVWYLAPDRDVLGLLRNDGSVRTFGGSRLSDPQSLIPGEAGTLWFAAGPTALARAESSGAITVHHGQTNLSEPFAMANGPDGNVWFTAPRVETDDAIGRVTPGGEVQTFDDEPVCRTTAPCFPVWGGRDLVTGPDGNLWFIDTENQVVRSTPDGDLAAWAAPGQDLSSLVVGPDGNLWMAGSAGGRGAIFRLAVATGRIRTFTDPHLGRFTGDLVAGTDGRLWFAVGSDRIGRMTVGGAVKVFADRRVRDIEELQVGSDGTLWFSSHRQISQISPQGRITGFRHPNVGRAVALTPADDGDLWFVGPAASRVGRISPTGQFSLLRHPDFIVSEERVEAVATGDGVWVTSTGNDRLVEVTTTRTVTSIAVAPLARGLVVAADGDLWFGIVGGVGRLDR